MCSDFFANISASICPVVESSFWDSKKHRSFTACARNPKSQDEAAVSPIGGLFALRGPSAVELAVPEIYVNPINGVAVGPMPHINKKLLKGCQPFRANSHATRSVMLKGGVFAVRASLNHARPANVFRARRARRMAMHQVCGRPTWAKAVFFPQNAATASRSIFVRQQSGFDNCLSTTFAIALPTKPVSWLQGWELLACSQSAKFHPSKVFVFHCEIIDGHASDVRLMKEAWPTVR